MSFSVDKIPDLSGKTAIVTGGNTGIGLITVKELLRKNAKVYLAARNPSRAQAALDEIKKELPHAKVEFMQLDLGDLKQVKEAANKFVASGEPLHILVNNAGIMMNPYELTKDGIENQFGTNHIGHFAFTTTLLPVIERSAPSRIVNVSSHGHNYAPSAGVLFDKINDESALNPVQRYGQSKLSNILFTKSLADRFEGKQVWVNVIHPGVVDTELARGPIALIEKSQNFGARILRALQTPLLAFSRSLMLTPQQGALTQLYAAASPEIETQNYRGQYFVPFGKVGKLSKPAENKELREKLWEFSEKLVAEKIGK
ncbi:hypothetical protein BJ742DRAFT_845926 [Cladochytrium replicatum]|nr:hypothetical protein BJ742DRAFT_845926 [Cladochytrium replicatum]